MWHAKHRNCGATTGGGVVVETEVWKHYITIMPSLLQVLALTLGRFEVGAASGVPSRFSDGLFLTMTSSRYGLTFKSAYFLQLIPQLSQRTFVASARALGAFHHTSDSLVRQAPQLLSVRGSSVTMEPSSSESAAAARSGSGFPAARAAFMRAFCSPSFALERGC